MATKRWSGLNTYTVHEAQNASLGQGGSALITGTALSTVVAGKSIVAITFLENTQFHADGLIQEDVDGLAARDIWVNSATASVNSISNGSSTDGEVFAAGVTIYGRWTSVRLSSGKVMVYLG